VSILAPADGGSSSLDAALRQAGAVFATHEGRAAAIHYGSAAGELAVCVSAVGLVDRSDLTTLALEAPSAQLAQLTSRLAGGEIAPGGALDAAGVWWCGAASDTLVVVCRRDVRRRLIEALRVHAAHQVSLRVLSVDYATVGLLGPQTPHVLRALGVYGADGDPRAVAPFGRGTIAGTGAWWLLESDRSALVLVDRDHAGEVWRAIERAGRPFGLSCVGQEAAGRYSLLERTRSRAAALVG
jgi:glycine cleavage system aminomethyltransferase T